MGNKDALAFVKIEMPTILSSSELVWTTSTVREVE